MKRIYLAAVACFAYASALAQEAGEPSMKEKVDNLLSNLASPATVQIREWQPSMQGAGRELLQRCLTNPVPACQGLKAGQMPVANVTVTVSVTSDAKDDDAFSLNESCQLQTVRVKASQPSQGVCLWEDPPPPDPPDGQRIGLYPTGALAVYYSGGVRVTRLSNLVPNTSKRSLQKCDVSSLQSCQFEKIRRSCLSGKHGQCVLQLASFECPAMSEKTQWVCEQKQDESCAGDKCAQDVQDAQDAAQSVTVSHEPDFSQAMMMLEVARQAGSYTKVVEEREGRTLIFNGSYAECRDKVAWGLGDCCRGGSPSDTHNRAALANLGIGLAINGVESIGSPHVHDLLFIGSDLERSLKGLGTGIKGLASAFTPSLSLYGVEVGLSNGALTFGFDPASFAVAVALAVVTNLLECDQSEQLLGLRIGNGLCVQTANWCSRSSWFGCREEREAYCCYNSRLARIMASAMKGQLGRMPADCSGFNKYDLRDVDFSAIDLSEVIEQFNQPGTDTDALMRRFQVANAGRYTTVTVNAP